MDQVPGFQPFVHIKWLYIFYDYTLLCKFFRNINICCYGERNHFYMLFNHLLCIKYNNKYQWTKWHTYVLFSGHSDNWPLDRITPLIPSEGAVTIGLLDYITPLIPSVGSVTIGHLDYITPLIPSVGAVTIGSLDYINYPCHFSRGHCSNLPSRLHYPSHPIRGHVTIGRLDCITPLIPSEGTLTICPIDCIAPLIPQIALWQLAL